MPAMLFRTCCCCVDLRTGSLIIGYLQLIILIIAEILFMTLLSVKSKHIYNLMGQYDATSTWVVTWALLLIIVLGLAFAIILLVGIHKNKHGHVKAYLAFKALILVQGITLFFALLSTNEYVNNVIPMAFYLLLYVVVIYFVLMIRSYYYEMKSNNQAPVSVV